VRYGSTDAFFLPVDLAAILLYGNRLQYIDTLLRVDQEDWWTFPVSAGHTYSRTVRIRQKQTRGRALSKRGHRWMRFI